MPKGAQPWVLTLLRTVFDQPDADQVGAQFARVVGALEAKFPAAAEHLAAAQADLVGARKSVVGAELRVRLRRWRAAMIGT